MKSRLIIILLIIVLTTIIISESNAQVQRMGILQGNYQIEPNGSIRVKTFCVDPKRDIPSDSTSFLYLLTHNQKAKVRIGKQTFNLQDAINKNLIEIKGIKLIESINDTALINSLSEEDKTYFLFVVDIIENPGKITFKKLLKIYDYPFIRRTISDEELQMIDQIKDEYESMSLSERVIIDSFLNVWMSMFLEPINTQYFDGDGSFTS
ncbi:MAG: hypothetical protein M1419_00575, partial [Bacteroidetes bacterium]|nr:hypothetical protein [Bacteroidota bacterium]